MRAIIPGSLSVPSMVNVFPAPKNANAYFETLFHMFNLSINLDQKRCNGLVVTMTDFCLEDWRVGGSSLNQKTFEHPGPRCSKAD